MGDKTTVVNNQSTTRELSQDEIEFNTKQLELLTTQVEVLNSSAEFQQGQFDAVAPLIAQQSQLLESQIADLNDPVTQEIQQRSRELQLSQLEAAQADLPIQQELRQLQLDEIRRGGAATDEQKALIGEVTDRALESGEIDIDRFLDDALGRLRTELAPARGLRPGDTPITDVGDRVAAEAVRQRGQLVSNLRGAQASAELNFPLAVSQLTSGQAGFQQQVGQATSQFQAQLAAAASQNRLQVSNLIGSSIGQTGSGGIGLTSVSGPGGFIQSGTTTSSGTSTESTSLGLGSILAGAGGLLTGLGGVGFRPFG